MPPSRLVRLAGWTASGALLLVLLYLLVYHSALALLGPHEIYRLLGHDAYDRWFAGGGIVGVTALAFVIALHTVPFLVLAAIAAGVSRILAPPQRKAAFFVALGVLATACVAVFRAVSPGTPLELVASLAFAEDTVYAPGFDERSFRSVAIGDSREAVLERLGEPLERWNAAPNGVETWSYTASPGTHSYWLRSIRFDDRGRVTKKDAEFYVD
jgi:hypothetical protein